MTVPEHEHRQNVEAEFESVAQPYGTGAASIRKPMRYGSRRQLRLLQPARKRPLVQLRRLKHR